MSFEKNVRSIVYHSNSMLTTHAMRASNNGKQRRKEIFLISFQIDEFENGFILYIKTLK